MGKVQEENRWLKEIVRERKRTKVRKSRSTGMEQ